jgi:hypothetical protein
MTTNNSANDPYHIPDVATAEQSTQDAKQRGGVLRPVLWLLFAISAAANVVTSTAGLSLWANIGTGLVTLSLGVALGVNHFRNRRA